MLNENDTEQIHVFDAKSRPYGLTYGQWTVKWWKWFLSNPKNMNPILDMSGRFASINQPSRDVWFLAGKLGSKDKNVPSRFCKIPSDRSILFPVINCEANFLEYPELRTEHDLVNYVNRDENTITSKECFINNKRIPVIRIRSDPAIFDVEINEDNIYDIKTHGKTKASGDGYWVFLKRLAPGNYFVSFRGSCQKAIINSGADYHLEMM
jgi:hypothetical protein